jgi:hypothetical protein
MPSTDLRAAITSAPMSAVLIAVNLTVFVAVSIEGRLLELLALPPDWAGVAEQPWTLLTVFFTAEVLSTSRWRSSPSASSAPSSNAPPGRSTS